MGAFQLGYIAQPVNVQQPESRGVDQLYLPFRIKGQHADADVLHNGVNIFQVGLLFRPGLAEGFQYGVELLVQRLEAFAHLVVCAEADGKILVADGLQEKAQLAVYPVQVIVQAVDLYGSQYGNDDARHHTRYMPQPYARRYG